VPERRVADHLWFYEESGPNDGPAIVLLHGLFFDGRMWQDQVPALAALGRVVVFDGPGHGRSDVPPSFTLEDHADALAEGVARASLAVVGRTRRLFAALPTIEAPALVVCGEDDRTTPVAHSRRIAECIPRAQLTLVRGCGHMTALEQPGRIGELLAAFVTGLDAGLDRTPASSVEGSDRRIDRNSRPIAARRGISRVE
jgi:pimeloyl-ACP methyl ester carboxylesterase